MWLDIISISLQNSVKIKCPKAMICEWVKCIHARSTVIGRLLSGASILTNIDNRRSAYQWITTSHFFCETYLLILHLTSLMVYVNRHMFSNMLKWRHNYFWLILMLLIFNHIPFRQSIIGRIAKQQHDPNCNTQVQPWYNHWLDKQYQKNYFGDFRVPMKHYLSRNLSIIHGYLLSLYPS